MTGLGISPAQANLKLSLWQLQVESVRNSDLYLWLQDCGLPQEVVVRLHRLVDYTEEVGGKTLALGKIILLKLVEFVKSHPNLTAGAAVGAAAAILVNAIPFLGPVLAPVLGPLAVALGVVAGHRLDKRAQGREISGGMIGFAEDVIEIARDFFGLLIEVFNVCFQGVLAI